MPKSQRQQTENANELLEMARSLSREQVEVLLKWSRQLGKLDPSISSDQPKIIALMTHPLDLGGGVVMSGETASRLLKAAAMAIEGSRLSAPVKAAVRG